GRRARWRLAAGLSQRDPKAFLDGALGLVGLGEGLTPAGDDCLVGALAVTHRFARSWLHGHPEIRAAVARTSAAATTDIAREFVAHALAGHFADSLIDLMTAEAVDGVTRPATRWDSRAGSSCTRARRCRGSARAPPCRPPSSARSATRGGPATTARRASASRAARSASCPATTGARRGR